MVCIVFLFCAAAAIAAPAQNALFTTLVNFADGLSNGANAARPYWSLIQARDGNFYGTTPEGGAYSGGTVFKVTPEGELTTLYSFFSRESDGADPFGGLVQASDGNFYGTTAIAGAYGLGTVFKITPDGTKTTLHSFDGTDGAYPWAALVQASDGNFYGTTYGGGANPNCTDSCGTVFKITPAGSFTTLYSFCAQTGCPDGFWPYAGLVRASDGNFYGTTYGGGTSGNCTFLGMPGCGTVFKITAAGELTTLHSFEGNDGAQLFGGLVQATDGNFYGITFEGGSDAQAGTVFKMTPAGTVITLHIFEGSDGRGPWAALVQATDGNFYGTTVLGGASPSCPPGVTYGCGTVFKITPDGALTTLHSFGLPVANALGLTDGNSPYAGLVQATNGNLYGTTRYGGAKNDGTVYNLRPPR